MQIRRVNPDVSIITPHALITPVLSGSAKLSGIMLHRCILGSELLSRHLLSHFNALRVCQQEGAAELVMEYHLAFEDMLRVCKDEDGSRVIIAALTLSGSVFFLSGVSLGRRTRCNCINAIKKPAATFRIPRASVFDFVHTCKGCLTTTNLSNRLAGSHLPAAVSYCLHCKKAANSAPHKLMRTSHNDPCNIQIMSTTTIKNVMVKDGFCSIVLAPLSERHYPSIVWLKCRASVNSHVSGAFAFLVFGNTFRPEVEGTRR